MVFLNIMTRIFPRDPMNDLMRATLIYTACAETCVGTKVDVISGRHTVPFWVKPKSPFTLCLFFSNPSNGGR